ncbi:MAG: metal transporter [Anaerolineae bacterium]|nr:metal transporter [Anaerolineae bacterium]
MSQQSEPITKQKSFSLITAILLILPLILLGGVIVLFLRTGGGLQFSAPAPVEALTVERTILKPANIDLIVRNGSPEEITIAQVIVNEAVRPFTASPSTTIPRLGQATIQVPYGWVEGEAYGVTLFTTNAVAFDVEIPVAFTTPEPTGTTFWGFTLIGIYVGIIPIYLGIIWFPALRQLSRRWMIFFLALTVGLLIFLGVDTLAEAIEQVEGVPGPFQGVGLIGIGAVATFLLLSAISQRQVAAGKSEVSQRLRLSYMIAVGIGIHNLGEGLAIGAAFNLGEIALGSFLVVGFIIQNITEGLGIIAPILRDRPGIRNLILLGLVGGVPAVVGMWLGGFAPSPTLAVLFLAIGAGAIFQVAYEVTKLIRRDTARVPIPMTVFSGILAGMLLLWITGMFIK